MAHRRALLRMVAFGTEALSLMAAHGFANWLLEATEVLSILRPSYQTGSIVDQHKPVQGTLSRRVRGASTVIRQVTATLNRCTQLAIAYLLNQLVVVLAKL